MSTRFATAKCVILSMTAVLGLSLVAGCGSGGRTVGVGTDGAGSAGSRAQKGSITLNVKWPDRPITVAGKLVPVAANYIVVTATPLNSAGAASGTPVSVGLTRPTTSVTIPNLQTGVNYQVTATAYPDSTGTSTAQAIGSATTVTPVTAGTNATVNVTMFATVASVALTPASVQLQLGASTTLTATALDSSGNVVITTTGTTSSIVFTSSNSSVVAVSQSGNTATLTASSTQTGSATITAQYVENGVPSGQQGTGAFATATATVTTAGLGTGDWPKFHGNVGNTGMVPSSVPTVALTGSTAPYNSTISQQVNGSIVYSSPTFNKAGTIMYIGADDGFVYAFNINASGFVGSTYRWAYKTGGPIEGAPLVDVNDNVFVGSQDGSLYAIKDVSGSATTGTPQLLYKYTPSGGGAITGSPTIDSKGTIYFTTEPIYNSSGAVTTPGKLYFVDSLSGAAKTINGSPIVFGDDSVGYNTTPALNAAQDLVYVSSEAGVVYAVSTTNGLRRALYPLSGDTISQSSPVVGLSSGGVEMLFQGTTNGKLYEFRAAAINDGPVAGFTTYTATGSILATPAFNPTKNVVVIATYDNSSGQDDSRVAVVDAANGTELGRTTNILTYFGASPTAAQLSQAQAFLFASSPAISSDGSTVYIGCEDGHVYKIDVSNQTSGGAASGSSLGFTSLIETNGNSQVNPILIDSSPGVDLRGHVFIGGLDGSVYAIAK